MTAHSISNIFPLDALEGAATGSRRRQKSFAIAEKYEIDTSQ